MLRTKLLSDRGANAAFRLIYYRSLASTAIQTRTQSESRLHASEPLGLRCDRLPSGLFVATVDNNDPVAHISLIFKAGSRYETSENRGIVHRLRNTIGLSTNERTAIDFNFRVAGSGAQLTSSVTRDHFSIDIQIFRRNVGYAFQILDELMAPPFHVRPHELTDSTPQMKRELSLLKDNWPAYTLEKLHKAAFRRQGLANSLLSPKFAIGHHTAQQLTEFTQEHFTTGNAVLAAVGVDHENVMKWANHFFPLSKGPAVSSAEKSKLFSGELRKNRPTELAVVYMGGQSTGLKDVKGTIAYTVLANLLGTGPTVKWSDGQTRLAKAAKKATSNPFHVSASNIGYEDIGMFTLFYTCHWTDSASMAKAVMGELRSVASGVNDKDLQGAKNRAKYRILSLSENDDYILEDLAVQAAVRQNELCLTNDQVKAIDAVSAAEVQQAAKNILNGKLAMASIGRLDKTPYLDELNA